MYMRNSEYVFQYISSMKMGEKNKKKYYYYFWLESTFNWI